MASPISILKSVLNLNKNLMHVEEYEETTVNVRRDGEIFEQKGSMSMPDLTKGSRGFVLSAGTNARDMIKNGMSHLHGVLLILMVSLYIYVIAPRGSNVPNTAY